MTEHTVVSFCATSQEFEVDPQKRTIKGLAVPYGEVGDNGAGRWRFTKGSLGYGSDISRIKILVGHNPSQAIGYVMEAEDTDSGMRITAKIARTAEGDKALILAEDKVADGLSVGVRLTQDDSGDWGYYTDDDGVNLVYRAQWLETSLTPLPAFDDARTTSVRASSSNPMEGPHVAPESPDTSTGTDAKLDALTEALATFASGLAAIPDQLTEAFTKIELPQREASPSAASGMRVTREAPVYTLDGLGNSLVKDAWAVKQGLDGSNEARDRLRKYQAQTEDSAHREYLAKFTHTGIDSGDTAAITPPGYRPDLYVGELPTSRPLVDMLSHGSITNATPFTVPRFVSSSGLVGPHTEGERPTEGTLVLDAVTVTPSAASGKLPLTREILDSTNPAIDAIAAAAMREAYSAVTEAKVATMLELASGTDTNHDGISDAGIYLADVTGAGADLVYALRHEAALYPFRRKAPVNRLALGLAGFVGLIDARDLGGRPLLPVNGATGQPGYGSTGAGYQSVALDTLAGVPCWALDPAEAAAYLFNAIDIWYWESPLLSFRFEEKAGPEQIELALFGYSACAILRPSGVTSVTFTEDGS